MTEGEQEMANLVSPGFSSCWLPGPDGESLRKIKMIWLTPFNCQMHMASASASDIPATKQPSEKSSTPLTTTTTTTKVLSHLCDVFITPTYALSFTALHADGTYSCPRSSERGALA